MRIAHLVAVAALSLAGTGCAIFGGQSLSKDIAALAMETKPGGEFVIEIGPDGTVLGAEAEVPLDAIPKACLEAADRHVEGGVAVTAEKEFGNGKLYWEVVKQKDGKLIEILMNADGSLAGMEVPLDPTEVPELILRAGMEAAGGGTLVMVEKVSGPEAHEGEAYHVKVQTSSGEVLRVGVRLDGSVVRVVRKLKSEVRVYR